MATPVVMPQMGESIAEGTIVRWIKKVGDSVDRDEPLFEISTDKVDAEIPSPAAGTLLDIAVKEGETVPVNSVVATIGAAGEAAPGATGQSVQTMRPTRPLSPRQPPASGKTVATRRRPTARRRRPSPRVPHLCTAARERRCCAHRRRSAWTTSPAEVVTAGAADRERARRRHRRESRAPASPDGSPSRTSSVISTVARSPPPHPPPLASTGTRAVARPWRRAPKAARAGLSHRSHPRLSRCPSCGRRSPSTWC